MLQLHSPDRLSHAHSTPVTHNHGSQRGFPTTNLLSFCTDPPSANAGYPPRGTTWAHLGKPALIVLYRDDDDDDPDVVSRAPMAPPRRRITYILPPPTDPVPRLQLPPHGAAQRRGLPSPLLIPIPSSSSSPDQKRGQHQHQHPQHRLGVACLALDTSTTLAAHPSPEGILYSGGRDGLVVAWDLGMPMKPRSVRPSSSPELVLEEGKYRWELMTGWADDIVDNEDEDEDGTGTDGDVLGEVHPYPQTDEGGDEQGGRRGDARTGTGTSKIPYEERWEMDVEAFQPGKPSHFRQCVQAHTDWVNDILLCNYDQTVVSASSDGTVKAWSPHSATPSEPSIVGMHADYVRCLTFCRDQRWVASGSFDRTVRLWDVSRSSSLSPSPSSSSSSPPPEALLTLHPPSTPDPNPKASIYALATDTRGTLIASGSPERVVRMWDPRSGGRRRVGKLVGHTDNIRAILVSGDGRYMLTGSADASIKLWSLATQKCLHTFTHHTDSVWSLFSSHPSLESFYSGDRSGYVCRVDVEGCADVAEGECVVVCQDTGDDCGSGREGGREGGRGGGRGTEGVNKIVAMDDTVLWTATGSSSVRRWRAPLRRAAREREREPEEEPFEFVSPPQAQQAPRRQREKERESSQSPPGTSHQHHHRPSLSITDPSGAPLLSSSSGGDEEETSETWYGIPFDSLVRLTSPNEGMSTMGGFGSTSVLSSSFGLGGRGKETARERERDPEIATLYSAASVVSVPRLVRGLGGGGGLLGGGGIRMTSLHPNPNPNPGAEETLHPLRSARLAYESRDLASFATPLFPSPDFVIQGSSHGLVRSAVLNDRIHALTVDTRGGVSVWDVVRGVCVGRFEGEDVERASGSGRSICDGNGDEERERERSPREALETVRERIEGEAVVVSWAAVDTKTGLLMVHMGERCFEAEIYADEAGYREGERHFGDEVRGKWVLRNLFIHYIREVQRRARGATGTGTEHHRIHRGPTAPSHIDLDASSSPSPPSPPSPSDKDRERSSSDASRKSSLSSPSSQRRAATVINSPHMIPALAISQPLLPAPRALPLSLSLGTAVLSPIPQSPVSGLPTPIAAGPQSPGIPIPGAGAGTRRSATVDHGAPASRENDYFSLRGRRPSVSGLGPGPQTPGVGGVPPSPDDFSSWGAPGFVPKDKDGKEPMTPSTPGGSGGGFMGRLRAFGKGGAGGGGGKRQASEPMMHAVPDIVTSPSDITTHAPPKTPLQLLLSGPLSPPSSAEVPPVPIPSQTSILISEEAPSGWNTVYRGQVGSTGMDARALEEALPMWALEYLLVNRIPPIPMVKISFVLLPAASRGEGEEQLPELLNTAQSKLTASRFLRVRKLTHHVHDKLEKIAAAGSRVHSTATTPRSSLDTRSLSSGPKTQGAKPEELYEILCHDAVLPLDMTLAAVRQFVWRQSSELTMHYRRKVSAGPGK